MPAWRRDLPDGVALELRWIGIRWQQLHRDHAEALAVRLRDTGQVLLTLTPGSMPGATLPDHGPAAAFDQLRVIVYDACLAGVPPETVEQQLTRLRRDLSQRAW